MNELFASGRIVDLILGLIVAEALVLAVYRSRTGRGPALPDLLASLLAGACLLLAVRTALTGAGWRPVALCLAGALAAHLWDLRRRWPAGGAGTHAPASFSTERTPPGVQ